MTKYAAKIARGVVVIYVPVAACAGFRYAAAIAFTVMRSEQTLRRNWIYTATST